MPLENAKEGTPGFGRNVAREREAGKPEAQAVAIAYSKARGDDLLGAIADAVERLDGANSAEYEKAYNAHNVALKEYEVAVQAYRARKIGDDEYLKARKKRDAATAVFDKAFSKEASRSDADKPKPPTNGDYGTKYNAEAVQKAINQDKRIGGKEAKLIHGLLKGWRGDTAAKLDEIAAKADALQPNPWANKIAAIEGGIESLTARLAKENDVKADAEKAVPGAFAEFMRQKYGSNWVVARKTDRLVMKYGEGATFLSSEAYAKAAREYETLTGRKHF